MKKSANHVQSNNEMAIPDGMTVFNTEDVDTNKPVSYTHLTLPTIVDV